MTEIVNSYFGEDFVKAFMDGKVCPNCSHDSDATFCGQWCVYGDCFEPKEDSAE